MNVTPDSEWVAGDLPKVILVASYPRSGNNWLCFLIGCILERVSKKNITTGSVYSVYDIDYLHSVGQHHIIRDSNRDFIVIKTHKLPYMLTECWPILSSRIILSVTLMRNPLDIIISLFNFLRMHEMIKIDIDLPPDAAEAEMMRRFHEYAAEFIENGGYTGFLQFGFGNWKDSILSWENPVPLGKPSHWLRYKDLVSCPYDALRAISATGSLGWTHDEIVRSVQDVSKDRVRELLGKQFVLKGSDGYYADFLSADEIRRADAVFGELISRFAL